MHVTKRLRILVNKKRKTLLLLRLLQIAEEAPLADASADADMPPLHAVESVLHIMDRAPSLKARRGAGPELYGPYCPSVPKVNESYFFSSARKSLPSDCKA